MITALIILAAVIEVFGTAAFIISEEPRNAGEGAFLLTFGWFIWPFFLLGWIISRPFA